MKCPKCNYTSFDYLNECKQCGQLLDEVKKRLNLQLSKPSIDIEETVAREAEGMVEDSAIGEEKSEPFSDQDASLEDSEEREEEDLIAVSSTDNLTPLEGLGTMESLQDEDVAAPEKDDIGLESVQTEESQEIITGFNPSDEQLEELQIQEKTDILEEELPELDMEIADENGDSSEEYDHGKIIELTEDDQIFDLELDLDDK